MTEVERQLSNAGYLPAINELIVSPDGKHLRGVVPLDVIDAMVLDARFASGVLYQLHKKDFKAGARLAEFRSFGGSLGDGSLQIVFDRSTGEVYADVDRHNPYQDVVGFIGHSGEVIGGFFRKVFGRSTHEKRQQAFRPPGDPQKEV